MVREIEDKYGRTKESYMDCRKRYIAFRRKSELTREKRRLLWEVVLCKYPVDSQ